ncbi:hypothetical protein B0H17DRAFT_1202597 [Mycena rosella]|uniref:Uncharacterized protein n=1 Tax=Mycena rosella TaxID=1033263 RepID=A0AAD7GFR9_MYCRO|nr:hypothetical protein B0H17DRAFT_1202597 [Mycena rosella]
MNDANVGGVPDAQNEIPAPDPFLFLSMLQTQLRLQTHNPHLLYPPHQSDRVPKPSENLLCSMMSQEEEHQAKVAGKDWAWDNKHPSVNTVDVGWEDFNATLLESPWVFTSIVKGGGLHAIPCSYREVMHEPDKWLPAMTAEVDQLEKRGVWELVDLPKGERTIDGMWVYNVKEDAAARS